MMDFESGWRAAKPGKTKAEKRNEKRMRNSYFTQQYEAFGENFSNFKTAQDIKKDSFKIFKALSESAIDIEKHYKCFLDPTFVGVLKDIAYEKMSYHYCTAMGLEMYINQMLMNNVYIEGYIYEYYSQHQRSSECYSLLFQAFSNIQLTGDYETTLSILMPQLAMYRNSL